MTDPDIVDALKTLIDEFTRSGVATLHVRSGEFELLLSNDPASSGGAFRDRNPEHASSPSPTAAPLEQSAAFPISQPVLPHTASNEDKVPEGAVVVKAPNLGTFYRAPKPGAAFYVEVGSTVAIGQEICLIEVMKLFTAVQADQAGRVHAVLATDGAMVEAGQPLFVLVAG